MARTIQHTPDIIKLDSHDEELPDLRIPEAVKFNSEAGTNIVEMVKDKQSQEGKELPKNRELLVEEEPHTSFQTEKISTSFFENTYSKSTEVKQYINKRKKRPEEDDESIFSAPEGHLVKRISRNGTCVSLMSSGIGTETADNKSSELLRHREALKYYCRMCCKRYENHLLKPSPDLRLISSEKLMKVCKSEDPDVYPSNFCTYCIFKFKNFVRLGLSVPLPINLRSFPPHGADCRICIAEKVSPSVNKDSNSVITLTVDTSAVSKIQAKDGSVKSSLSTSHQIDKIVEDNPANKTVCKFDVQKTSIVPPVTGKITATNAKDSNVPSSDQEFHNKSSNGNESQHGLSKVNETHITHENNFTPSQGAENRIKNKEELHQKSLKVIKNLGQSNSDINSGLEPDGDYFLDDIGVEKETVVNIPLDQVIESQKKIAKVISCFHCEMVPLDPYVSNCAHIFCKNCIGTFTECAHHCADQGRDLKLCERNISFDSLGICRALVNTFIFRCKNMCGFVGTAQDLLKHQLVCLVEMDDELLGSCESETRLKIEQFLEYGDQYCEDNSISQEFVLFYSLRRFLKLKGDKRRVALLMQLWKDTGKPGVQLSPEDCLVLRVFLGQGKKSYNCHYNFLKRHLSISYLRSPKQVEQLAQMFYPPSADFSLESEKGFMLYKRVIDECVEPRDLGELVSSSGIQWKLTAAIAKTLQELAFEFQHKCSNQPNTTFTVEICDKYGKVKASKLARFQMNENISKHLIQYSFCILTVSRTVNEKSTVLYSCDDSGRQVFRTIAVALPDDSIKDSQKLLMHPIEEEKRNLIGKFLTVRLPNGLTGKFLLNMPCLVNYGTENVESLSPENLDVNEYGEFCRFCDSDKKSWLENMGSCSTKNNLKGDLSHCALNPTQFDVNFVKLLNNIVVRESSGVYKPLNQCTSAERKILKSKQWKWQSYLLQQYSIEPDCLILEPIEYVKKYFAAWETGGYIKIIGSKTRQGLISQVFWRYLELRSVYLDTYNSEKISKSKLARPKSFRGKAVTWLRFLRSRFPYVAASSYLHLLVEHVEDILQLPNNPGNKVNIFSSITKSTLVEYLKSAWLKSSPYLKKRGSSFQNVTTCHRCHKIGHRAKNCPERVSDA